MNRPNIHKHLNAYPLTHALQVALVWMSIGIALPATAQEAQEAEAKASTGGISIGGSVYGAGKGSTATVKGNSQVEITYGTIERGVFGGSCMADVEGYTYVYVHNDANQKTRPIIHSVYGGNDVAGTISNSRNEVPLFYNNLDETHKAQATPSAYVRVTNSADAKTNEIPFVANLYGGGNGEYTYTENITTDEDENPVRNYTVQVEGQDFEVRTQGPQLERTFIDIEGGTIARTFGGGNSATVNQAADIYLHASKTAAVADVPEAYMPAYTTAPFTTPYDQVFGGNNKVAMAIRPTWHLQSGYINNLYSGGNQGDMTNALGIFLGVESSDMKVNNVYGGCRMADVTKSATVTIEAGEIGNVYGGNDISGNIQEGTNVNIHHSILGDVYGGGNGSYAYTDQESLKNDARYADLYYASGANSAEALNHHRPNAALVNVTVQGKSAEEPTYIGGSLYCGGNSATLRDSSGQLQNAKAKLTLGSYVIANQVFLGSNGENMVKPDMLQKYADDSYSSLKLTQLDQFEEYMKGVEVAIKPEVEILKPSTGTREERDAAIPRIGSLYCGGNVGSMSAEGYFDLAFLQNIIIYDKLVGGCNNANVQASDYNAYHEGGLTSHNDTKVTMDINGLTLQPMRLTQNTDGTFAFTENRVNGILQGGNIYGGCYQSGYVNGGVQINLMSNSLSRIAKQDVEAIRDNVFSTALTIFGAGYGEDSEIWGNTTVNISDEGNIAKVFGGGERGVVGRTSVDAPLLGSTTINMIGGEAGKIYGGGFEGLVTGNTTVKLDGGSVYDAIAGACNANVGGYTQLLMGTANNNTTTVLNNVYGGNDFGGQIAGTQSYAANGNQTVTANTYVLYKKGQVKGNIFGGACGSYDYTQEPYSSKAAAEGFQFPNFTTTATAQTNESLVANAFVDINAETDQVQGNIYGGGRGFQNAVVDGRMLPIVDMEQSYVLLRSGKDNLVANNILGGGYYSVVRNTRVDALSGKTNILYGGTFGETAAEMKPEMNYNSTNTTVNIMGIRNDQMDVFGGGANTGAQNTWVNLLSGYVKDVYGGSNMEGTCQETHVNVPQEATDFYAHALYGGAYGSHDNLPCDVIRSHVTFSSEKAYIYGHTEMLESQNKLMAIIFGGNNNKRATQSTHVEINTPVWTSETRSSLANVCGGGNGSNSIAGFTQVILNKGAQVNSIYGGGRDGKVFGHYNDLSGASDYYARNAYAHWTFAEPKEDAIWGTAAETPNTQIVLNEGAMAYNVYGAGYGSGATVAGNTKVLLNGGTVVNDIYGGGYAGHVQAMNDTDLGSNGLNTQAQTGNIYTSLDLNGGTVTNVYGGGYNGNVGLATVKKGISSDTSLPQTRIKIGTQDGRSFVSGIPAIKRSLYGGGYKGAVYGKARIQMFNGYQGYAYNAEGTDNPETKDMDERYEENLNYEGSTANLLGDNGNVFGGGFGEGATVDQTEVCLWGGIIRNSLYGGGEIAAIGRGTVNSDKKTATIEAAGQTLVKMYGGLVIGNVFGGGRGYAIDAYGNTQSGEIGYSDGYTFGKTEVNIYRGTVGTPASVLLGQGNVFGGGNIGYVYTASGTKNAKDGYYYKDNLLTEDCKVFVAPQCKALQEVTIDGTTYAAGQFVPTEKLNRLTAGTDTWNKLDNLGVNIGNAVFAGGNVSAGSDQVYANAKTVFGNATASITDVFNKDFVTIGSDGIGGLYGDGNLTFVDGYRELNITNYGTDYYKLNNQLSYDEYMKLTDRERAYFILKYVVNAAHTYSYYECKIAGHYNDEYYKKGQKITIATYQELEKQLTDEEKKHWSQGNTSYKEGDQITEDDFGLLDPEEQRNWNLFGFCTLHAGRIINTIQRADFCGIFGSRVVMRGARDRVPSIVDYTDYTINRVDEVSLNQMADPAYPKDENLKHGNYFGIYSVVNYLGALTSDVTFNSVRTTENIDNMYQPNQKDETYKEWKQANLGNRKRNNGSSNNEVALASGVWLEILDKASENNTEKIYGPITGIIQLDLINVAPDEGGGYVYAKNVHGIPTATNLRQVTLTAANQGAVSQKQFAYATPTVSDKMQSSGNFVHSTKRIIDDCYPLSNAYYGDAVAPAHYWYIRGQFYVYDQYISAYTGSAQAYAETTTIPLTISAESQGRLKLYDIKENLYAYWTGTIEEKYQSPKDPDAIVIQGITYKKNDPISYWTWSRLNDDEKEYFLGKTYVCTESNSTYPEGQVLTAEEYSRLPEADKAYFNISNALSHDYGFLMTFDWDNPDVWNTYYQRIASGNSDEQVVRQSLLNTFTDEKKAGYIASPSVKMRSNEAAKIMGQLQYGVGELIDQDTYDYQSQVENEIESNNLNIQLENQASFDKAWVVKSTCQFTDNGKTYDLVEGACISDAEYQTLSEDGKARFDVGMLCTTTYQKDETEIYLCGTVITEEKYNSLKTEQPNIENNFSKAYLCTQNGAWGGNLYYGGKNYPALKYASLSAKERQNFTYNYDALDLLSEGFRSEAILEHYQGAAGNNANRGEAISNQIPYTEMQSLDYTATYTGSGITLNSPTTLIRDNQTMIGVKDLKKGDVLATQAYESLVNEQHQYTPLVVRGDDTESTYYVVNTPFQLGDVYHMAGKKISETIYENMKVEDKTKVTQINREALPDLPSGNDSKNYYFCSKPYKATTSVTDLVNKKNLDAGEDIPVGVIITDENYRNLQNEQRNFYIDGRIPSATSTLYVARDVDINQLTEDKIVTAIYTYEYVEGDETGNSYETIRERHIVNIRVHFESGVPTIGELLPPSTVLPSTKVGLNNPTVKKGAYEILGGGWEMYTNDRDATAHENGVEYINRNTPMYWYQDGYWVAYYAKSYLGKTYSNPVQISVANYHRMADLLKHTHSEKAEDGGTQEVNDYMYVNEPSKRLPKIYIKDAEDMEAFKTFFSKSYTEENLDKVRGGANLDFILQGDIQLANWESLGKDDDHCFGGNFHGDGHTLSGLSQSLFKSLCGNVYNLGVTGNFTTAGIADEGDGYVENSWIATTDKSTKAVNAVLGNPTRLSEDAPIQLKNCYYLEGTGYTNPTSGHGVAKGMSLKSFVDGEVAYNLNGFYLEKRYQDHQKLGAGYAYTFWNKDQMGQEGGMPHKGYYDGSANPYVEDRYNVVDFIYANGEIPLTKNIRLDAQENYSPVYPDDYIFFGQNLTYNIVTGGGTQDEHPKAVLRTDEDQLLKNDVTATRVFRAPGYYMSKKMDAVYFNNNVALADQYTVKAVSEGGLCDTSAPVDLYSRLTAVDFTGYNDTAWKRDETGTPFYAPVLDYQGLASFQTQNLTQNLLVYAPEAGDAANGTESKVMEKLNDFSGDPVPTEGNYRTIAKLETTVKGHIVKKVGNAYEAATYHLLMDKQNFNAPIPYAFTGDNRMWYQRTPEVFANGTKGWETICLPFTAELVTTHQKGEITHFYGADKKESIGHEYWLRGLKEVKTEDMVTTASFLRPMTQATDAGYDERYLKATTDKIVSNSFLWDYYYSQNGQEDANDDTYQQFWNEERTYAKYPHYTEQVPYIIAFPGESFYEFDMSGTFKPAHTKGDISKLEKQTVTFLSQKEQRIAVSDDEQRTSKANGYTYSGHYQADDLTAGAYALDAGGERFEATTTEHTAVPFRAYFEPQAGQARTESILIGMDADYLDNPDTGLINGTLQVYGTKQVLHLISHMDTAVTLPVYTTSGQLVQQVTVASGAHVQLHLAPGIYIAHGKKVIVK